MICNILFKSLLHKTRHNFEQKCHIDMKFRPTTNELRYLQNIDNDTHAGCNYLVFQIVASLDAQSEK